MDATDGLTRGQEVRDTGAQISVPVGPKTLGRILNVVGEPIDERGPIGTDLTAPIHAQAPELLDHSTESSILFTGTQVIYFFDSFVKCANNVSFGCALICIS